MSQTPNKPTKQSAEINIREELEKYLRFWPWFVFCILIALGIAFLILRQTTPIYSTAATILIKDGKNSQSSEMAAFSELGLMGGMNSNSIENEIGILRSRRLMESVVKSLDIHIRYFDEEALRSPELYKQTPIIANLLLEEEQKLEAAGGNFMVRYRGDDKLEIIRLKDEKVFKTSFGEPVNLGFSQVIFTRNEKISKEELYIDRPILVKFSPVENIANAYRKNLNVNIKEQNSSLIELSVIDEVPNKSEDVLDRLVVEYNREAIEDKNLVAMNTAEFIDERLMIINEELDSVETGKVEFKESNQLTDIEAESELFMSTVSETKQKQQEIGTQLELADAMMSYLNTSTLSDLLPANLGIEESAVNTQIAAYNELVLERNKVLRGSSEMNPVVIRLNNQIEELKYSVKQSLLQMRSNLKIAEKNLESQAAAINSRIADVPSTEQKFRGIERQQQIKETLYLFLLQKREENALSLAVTAPKAKIVDTAFTAKSPISPNPKNFYLISLLIGFGVPFAFIYLKDLLNNKVRGRTDIEQVTGEIPVVGEIPKIGKNQEDLISVNDRSVLAESFRILHTNLQYLLVNSGGKKEGISILVTSTVKGEGKTFTAFNLAITLANTGKKVLVVGGDLRNPQLQRYEVESRNYKGVSDYLVNNNLSLSEVIKKSTLHENLNLLTSGSIPPNPSELLRQEKAKQMFKDLEGMYDYIIIDTAPSMLVADTFLINQYADLTLYVVRAGYTEKKLLDFAVDSKNNGKLSEVSFVLNNVETANFGYGNKYGYAYGEDSNKLWDRLKNKAAF